ncbi:MAG: T9SS type A sorting domain-containing protein, partial [Paludibacteraceae bacterium]|nr:T9SS type A sorting domain-containing protein [Paludibacteraceae bacterium]
GTINIKNNILISNETGTTMKVWGIRRVGTAGTFNSDYNDIYANSSNNYVGYYNASDAASLSDWQTASGKDVHSKSKDVNFVSATDLSLTGASIDDLDLAAPAIDGVTTDIFGNARHTPNVYMGAHEPNNLNDTQTFTVTVPNGTQHVYIAGTFIGKSWDITNPFELTAKANSNEFIGTFPAHSNVEYKYLCETGDWDYQEAVYEEGIPVIRATNRTYNPNDVVDLWYRVKSVTLNVSFEATVGVPNQLFLMSSINNWESAIELTKSGATFTGTLTNTDQKVPANTEYKYFTNEPNPAEQNWECNLDMTPSANRKTIAPVMNDTIQRFTTRLVTETEVPALAPRLMRTTTGIRVELTEPANIELYNINGSLIEKTKATGTYTRDLNNGIYIIRINGKSTKFVK